MTKKSAETETQKQSKRQEVFEKMVPAIKKTLLLQDEIHLSNQKILYEKYSDPLYVWEAIRYCQLPPIDRYDNINGVQDIKPLLSQDGTFLRKEDFNDYREFFTALSECPKKLMLPDWCSAYLSKAAEEIFQLYYEVAPDAGETAVSPPAAAARIPKLLGFVSKGKNCFLDYVRGSRRAEILHRFEELVAEDGLTKAEARRTILSEFALIDERNLQRIIAEYLARGGKT